MEAVSFAVNMSSLQVGSISQKSTRFSLAVPGEAHPAVRHQAGAWFRYNERLPAEASRNTWLFLGRWTIVEAVALQADLDPGLNFDMGRQQVDPDHADLTSTRKLSKNVLLNLFAEGVPLVVSLFCIPVLVRRLGTEQIGVLTLAWAVVGYFGIFDMGLGRALHPHRPVLLYLEST